MLAKSNSHQERVFDLQFDLFKDNALVSCGVKQISFWALIGNTLQKKKGIFGQNKDMQTMFCVAFSAKDKEVYYTGTMTGQIYAWKGVQLAEVIPNVHNGSIFALLPYGDGGFITGGKDGRLKTWTAAFKPIATIDLCALFKANGTAYGFYDTGKLVHIYHVTR